MKIHSRHLEKNDFTEMKELLLREGPNAWNFITEDSIQHQFDLIDGNEAKAILAEDEGIIGFAVLILGKSSPSKLEEYTALESVAYINDVVVTQDHSGKGIGKKLLLECVSIAKLLNYREVYVERHEENLVSAGMMTKAGFKLVETFHDPNKRFVGSRNTAVLKKCT